MWSAIIAGGRRREMAVSRVRAIARMHLRVGEPRVGTVQCG